MTKVAKKEDKKSAKKKPEKKKVLVIVESPAKAKTIEKYLGTLYTVKASMGHLIDLPKSRMAIDVDNNFEPEYITVRGRAKLLKELQKDAGKSASVLLASDNDREGEAIAWHLQKSFLQKNSGIPVSRISFNEITPQAIKDAVAHPTEINSAKVNAQKARRVIDRLVGYNLSPLLWKKVKNGLSAGRVQSVALRLICEREKEVEGFIPEEYWSLAAELKKGRSAFSAQLALWKGNKPDLKKEADAAGIIEEIKNSSFTVSEVRETEKTMRPKPPFTTSSLQQTAANRLGWTSKKTMQIAQQLYEGVNIGKSRVGLITYMRTDSVRIAETALAEARSFISKNYPAELPEKPVYFSIGKSSQDAHEAIRPTYPSYTPDYVKKYLARDQEKLYSIIWERFISSQMKNARAKTLSADITAGNAVFRVSGTNIVEKGFYKALSLLASKEDKDTPFPPVKKDDALALSGFKKEQHWTLGPPRYSDASIVKTLEEKGIGRPSTYAPTISLLLERFYVQRANKQLIPTTLGKLICDMLVENFSDVIDTDFTASMETLLDEVEEKSLNWPDMIRDFYAPFKKKVDTVAQTLESQKGLFDEPTGELCEKCGKPMVKKLGKYGHFFACSGFPECKNSKSIPLAKCPKCGGDVVERKPKGRGKKFYGCVNYPECDFLTHFKPLNQNCPKCGWFLIEKYDKRSGRRKACINAACDYLHSAET
ncbi:MAG: type I DNA topoisomerase [Spirochaetaceae bacterium]|jgi:DNA topoisomerase-1|nr:type I DNA topoisomerase [Spirochaetaceae bacterium]